MQPLPVANLVMNKKEERERWEEKIKQRYPSLLCKLPCFQTDIGWNKILEDMIEEICRREEFILANNLQENYQLVRIVQIKEKYGGLRVYYDGGTNDSGINLIVSNAEQLADITCQTCGTTENVSKRYIKGWVSTLCEKCKEKKSL